MKLNHSYIFKENLNITFTYKDRSQLPHQNKTTVFQSVIFHKPTIQSAPLTEITQSTIFCQNVRSKRNLAQSMYQQNCQQLMNTSYCEVTNSVGPKKQSGLSKLMGLCSKSIEEQIYQTVIEDFQIGELLGKGAMGNVYICRHIQTGFFFALKKIKKKTVKDIAQFIYSIKVHMALDQPNIVKLYSVFNDKQHIYFLMELCSDGNLKSQSKVIRDSKSIKKTALGIAYGLRHLHKRNIRHGDIKLQNILCCYGMPKIADFDCISNHKNLSCSKRLNKKILGSPLYFSPEMMRESIYGLHDDVWSLGIIVYELICGQYPFSIVDHGDIQKIVHQNINQFPKDCDKLLENLTRKMLSKRLCQRPKLPAIIKQLESN